MLLPPILTGTRSSKSSVALSSGRSHHNGTRTRGIANSVAVSHNPVCGRPGEHATTHTSAPIVML